MSEVSLEVLNALRVNPGEGFWLKLLNGFPWARIRWSHDQFRFVIPIHNLCDYFALAVADTGHHAPKRMEVYCLPSSLRHRTPGNC